MLVTITQFERPARDANGTLIYLGADRLACEARTSAGAFAALSPRARFVRIATDTAIQMDIAGGTTTSADELFPANSIDFIAVKGGEVLTIATA